jgi:PAS domain S-box-containing protein
VRRLNHVADQIGDMISVHAPDGTYLYVSGASVALLGYAPEDLVGQSPYDLIHAGDVAAVESAHVGTLRDGRRHTSMYRMRRNDGGYVWFETIARSIRAAGSDDVDEIVCSSRDVTLREATQAERRDAHAAMCARIASVLEAEALDMVYQPICRLDTRAVVAYEALARFREKPERPPNEWFAEAAVAGLGVELELLAVRKALDAISALPGDAFLSINVSPDTLRCDELRDLVRPMPLRRLVFEITEHAPIEDYDEFIAVLRRLSSTGVRIAVDDAGAGYSSLRHILNLHPHTIKLDVSLTRELHRDLSRRALTAAMASFADELNATVIAEGIETEDELEALRRIGIELGQGYLLGRPGPIDRVPAQM